jgi:3-methyladenine DNA glycosylase AlkD
MKNTGPAKSVRGQRFISVEHIIDEIKRQGNAKAVAGMARFGIHTTRAFGVSIPQLRDLANKTGTNHEIAQELWKTGIHEAHILVSMIDDPTKVSEDQMENWQQTSTLGMSWMVAAETYSTKQTLRSERRTNGP